MLKAVGNLHKKGYIHRDINDTHFRLKNGKMYLIDFGISRKYLNSDGSHISFSDKA